MFRIDPARSSLQPSKISQASVSGDRVIGGKYSDSRSPRADRMFPNPNLVADLRRTPIGVTYFLDGDRLWFRGRSPIVLGTIVGCTDPNHGKWRQTIPQY